MRLVEAVSPWRCPPPQTILRRDALRSWSLRSSSPSYVALLSGGQAAAFLGQRHYGRKVWPKRGKQSVSPRSWRNGAKLAKRGEAWRNPGAIESMFGRISQELPIKPNVCDM
jgi:hypothetical protein